MLCSLVSLYLNHIFCFHITKIKLSSFLEKGLFYVRLTHAQNATQNFLVGPHKSILFH